MILLASFFLPSASLINICTCMSMEGGIGAESMTARDGMDPPPLWMCVRACCACCICSRGDRGGEGGDRTKGEWRGGEGGNKILNLSIDMNTALHSIACLWGQWLGELIWGQ